MYNSCKPIHFSNLIRRIEFHQNKKTIFFILLLLTQKLLQLGNLPVSRWINKVIFFHNSVTFALPVFLQIRLTLAKLF